MKYELFDENERYSSAASDFEMAIQNAIEPIINQYIKAGYKIRDLEYLTSKAVLDISLSALINWETK